MFSYNPNIYTGNLNKNAVRKAIEHCRKQLPNEGCGAIINDRFIPFANESQDPENSFEIHGDNWFLLYMNGEIDCLVHSHDNCNRATIVDQEQQQKMDIPWLIVNFHKGSVHDCIVFGEKTPAPLLGRPFFYGAFDCFTLLRDYMQMQDIILPNPPHKWEFWAVGEPVFETAIKNNPDLPFKTVSEVVTSGGFQVGDVLMYAVHGTRYINHVAVVYNDSKEVLHHVSGRISGLYPINFFRKYLRRVMRKVS